MSAATHLVVIIEKTWTDKKVVAAFHDITTVPKISENVIYRLPISVIFLQNLVNNRPMQEIRVQYYVPPMTTIA